MALKICLSGTEDIVIGTENFTEIEIQNWLNENQESIPDVSEEGYSSWVYPDLSKYILLNFEDGIHVSS